MSTKSMARARVTLAGLAAVVCVAVVSANVRQEPAAASGAKAPGVAQPKAGPAAAAQPGAAKPAQPGEAETGSGPKSASTQPAGGNEGAAAETRANGESGQVPEPHQTGGEADSVVQVANLVYAGTKSSKCFSDHFLVRAEKESAISTSRRFHAVKLGSEELFEFPLVIMTGEGSFSLHDR